jgi:hypothetical protein
MTESPDLTKMLLEFLEDLKECEPNELTREGLRLKAIELLSKIPRRDPKDKGQGDAFNEMLRKARDGLK